MPRRKLLIISGRENENVDCVSFYRDRSEKPGCHALNDVYCLKETRLCSFKKTVSGGSPPIKNKNRYQ